ncbi:hypothetical protein LCGC14_0568210 [marine sediment metagenome]|uniref:Uncharacterized protein n=1 Tax=marine sediment metagenome TaxID=412755 RepID=A0A0F9RQ84_9ZZZZ
MADKEFERFERENNRVPIPTANAFLTADITDPTPQTSPLVYSNSVITIAIPKNAAEVVFAPSTAMRVGEVVAMTQYYTIQAGSAEAFGVADMDEIYIVRDSADGVLNFRFLTI